MRFFGANDAGWVAQQTTLKAAAPCASAFSAYPSSPLNYDTSSAPSCSSRAVGDVTQKVPATGDPHGHHVRRPRVSGDENVPSPYYGLRGPAPGVRGGLAEGAAASYAALGSEGQEEGDVFGSSLPYSTQDNTPHLTNFHAIFSRCCGECNGRGVHLSKNIHATFPKPAFSLCAPL